MWPQKPMPLDFDIKKAIAAVAFLLQQQGEQLDMFLGLKMLYIADKNALIHWGKTITGDSFISMKQGPVLSRIYDLFKGTAKDKKSQQEWNAFFSQKVNNAIHLLKPVDIGVLSQREKEILEKSRQEILSCAPWEVADWLHQICPEWQDPKGSSRPIDPALILRNAGRTDEEIKTIKESNSTFVSAKEFLGIH
jgi:uncharacterized phage-associated protein